MTPKKSKDATEAVADAAEAATSAASAIAEAARVSATNSALKFRIWEAIIAGVVTVLLGWIQLHTLLAVNAATSATANTALKVDATAAEVKQVKETGIATHQLVNSGSLIDLELHLVTAKRLAEMSNDPRDEAAVMLVEKKIADHKEKMAKEEAAAKQNKKEAREDAKEKATAPKSSFKTAESNRVAA